MNNVQNNRSVSISTGITARAMFLLAKGECLRLYLWNCSSSFILSYNIEPVGNEVNFINITLQIAVCES